MYKININYIEKGVIKYNKKKIKKKKTIKLISDSTQQMINKRERLKGKEYKDFIEYTKENNNSIITEIDLVEGIKGSDTYLFTMFIPSIQFVFIFKRLFGILLADQGSEFLNHEIITKSIYDSYTRRCKIFYCEVGKPHQKLHVENIHRLLRIYIPKGVDISNYTQDDINFIVSNMNSLYKPKFKNKSL